MADFYNLFGGAMMGPGTPPPPYATNTPGMPQQPQPGMPQQQQPDMQQQQPQNNKAGVNNAKKNKNKNNNKKNNNNNNNKNNNSNSKSNNSTSNAIKERLENIKFTDNKAVISFWIFWFITVVLLLSTFITTPIRYSEESVVNKLNYNRLYYYLHCILLALLCFYAYKSSNKLELIKGEDIYQKILPIIVLLFGFLIINLFDSGGFKEDGSFNTAPSVIVKNKYGMIIHYLLLIIFLSLTILSHLRYNSETMFGLQSHHIYGVAPALIVGIFCIYLLYLTATYSLKKYKLPSTWRK